MILNGWPNHRKDIPQNIKQFFIHRDELNVEDDIIFRGERLVIPESM